MISSDFFFFHTSALLALRRLVNQVESFEQANRYMGKLLISKGDGFLSLPPPHESNQDKNKIFGVESIIDFMEAGSCVFLLPELVKFGDGLLADDPMFFLIYNVTTLNYGIDNYGSNTGIRPYFVCLVICGSVVQEPTLILLFWGIVGILEAVEGR